ncbi:MAG: hypothetical protein JWL73_2322 [Actinomycetia bacterium]|nr:hypothetical protein [Actinomycetes bacterium]
MSGPPRSANGASSFHAFWHLPPGAGPLAEVSATLEVLGRPAHDRLVFWALQASFTERSAARGAGHLGLQWHPQHPGSTAANWGGYDERGSELRGSTSVRPSALGNANTRDYPWEAGRPYRLSISRASDGWVGSIDGEPLRVLHAGGDALSAPMVWSEVFADCDAASTTIRWSALEAVTLAGERVPADGVTVNYQRESDGGCSNTDTAVDDEGHVIQRTAVPRVTPQGATLRLS